jgi:hypothetical protein
MELDLIKKKGKCCVTGKPMSTSEHINMVQLHFRAWWKYPVWGNILTKVPAAMALAFVHDEAIGGNRVLIDKVKYGVEFSDGDIIYHDVPSCRVCGCTDDWCAECIKKTGKSCTWIEPDLCSACKFKVSPIKQTSLTLDEIRNKCLLLFEQSVGWKFRVKGTPLVDEITGIDKDKKLVKGNMYGDFHIDLCELTNTDDVSIAN